MTDNTPPIEREHIIVTEEKLLRAVLAGVLLMSRSQSCLLAWDSPQAFVLSSQRHWRQQQPLPGLLFAGALPFSAGSLLVYMNLEKLWNGPRDRFSPLQNFINVCLAAAVTQTLSFPFDTVKRKMQVGSYLGEQGTSGRRDALLCLGAVAAAKYSDPG